MTSQSGTTDPFISLRTCQYPHPRKGAPPRVPKHSWCAVPAVCCAVRRPVIERRPSVFTPLSSRFTSTRTSTDVDRCVRFAWTASPVLIPESHSRPPTTPPDHLPPHTARADHWSASGLSFRAMSLRHRAVAQSNITPPLPLRRTTDRAPRCAHSLSSVPRLIPYSPRRAPTPTHGQKCSRLRTAL